MILTLPRPKRLSCRVQIPKDERVSKILEKGSYYYNFGDGWGANISVEQIANGREAKKEKKKSMGFCGYEWMIDSIEKNLKILT